ncbi:MAG: ParB/RepB/Spo0J family partition protein [Candidatus Liptonbacteria bacterium]|nr:ParB/RepB/Spo0J family partition protein [Candidatus Liptonbacteria bacterium]
MLGKGLESLIPPSQGDDGVGQPAAPRTIPEDAVKSNADDLKPHDFVFHIEVAKISPNPNQPRRNFDEAGIRELANSIREFGFLQPLVITRREKETPNGVEVSYELIAGERRLMAAKMLGLEVVPAIIKGVDREREKLELAIVENIQRENLNPIESARAFQQLQEEFRLTQREIASKLGKSRESVANTMRLLDLPPYVQEALEKGYITESHGRFLLSVANPGNQRRLFDEIMMKGLTTREVKERIRSENAASGTPAAAESPKETHIGSAPLTTRELPPEFKMAEEKLSSELGTPVKIEKKGDPPAGGGKITITFYSEEELESILRKIGGGDQTSL